MPLTSCMSLPHGARRYLLLMALNEPLLFSWYLLPYMLLTRGYTVLDIGLLYGAMSLGGAVLRPLLGRVFTTRDLRAAMASIGILEAMAMLLYSAAGLGYQPPVLVALGGVLENAARNLYFVYPAYERLILPRDRLGEAVACTVLVPEATGVAVFPLLGLAVDRLEALGPPVFFAASGAASLVLGLLSLRVLEPARPHEEPREKPPGIGVALRRIAGSPRLRSLVAGEILFTGAWSVAPVLAFTYILVEKYHATALLLGVANAAISAAGASSASLLPRLAARLGKPRLLATGTLSTAATLAALAVSPPSPLLVAPLFYGLRFWDAVVYMCKAEALYEELERREAALVTSLLSSMRQVLATASGPLAGTLASINPAAPLIAAPILLALSTPFYINALKQQPPQGAPAAKPSA